VLGKRCGRLWRLCLRHGGSHGAYRVSDNADSLPVAHFLATTNVLLKEVHKGRQQGSGKRGTEGDDQPQRRKKAGQGVSQGFHHSLHGLEDLSRLCKK